MGQVTVYLDAESEKRLKSAAKAAGMPVSRWIADVVKEKTRTEWPDSVRALAGAWPDFPGLKDIRDHQSQDAPREAL